MSNDVRTEGPPAYGDPSWEAVVFLPKQGQWYDEDFLKFHTNRMAELSNGFLEVLPMPNWVHQLIVDFFMDAIKSVIRANCLKGIVLFAPLPVRLFPGTIREPDVLYVEEENIPSLEEGYPRKVDLVVEVVSEGSEARKRDFQDKPVDYAKAGVSEYWIVDPEKKEISLLNLAGETFETTGVYRPGDVVESRYMEGLSIDVATVFALGQSTGQP